MKRYILAGLLAAASFTTSAQDDQQAAVDAFLASLKFQSGRIALPAAKASLELDSNFRFLDAGDAERVLSELWGNPPGSDAIGMLVPANVSLADDASWAVVITYSDEGYVSDEDAKDIDYTELLTEMQADTLSANEQREAAGYGKVELVGWATQPRYDAGAKKLIWAKELEFNDQPAHTLNYDMRVLGRSGYLSLNAVANMDQIATIEAEMPKLLAMTEFDAGSRYADFNESTDKIAGYGVAALVGGAVAAKTGLFGKLLALLLGLKKILIPLVVAIGYGIAKLFGKKKQEA